MAAAATTQVRKDAIGQPLKRLQHFVRLLSGSGTLRTTLQRMLTRVTMSSGCPSRRGRAADGVMPPLFDRSNDGW